MTDETQDFANRAVMREKAISRWDNEGGAGSDSTSDGQRLFEPPRDVPELTNAELVQLRVRVIALENLLIAMLSGASDRQLAVSREMATHITPRPGSTPHPLTIQAAAHMIDLIDRANRFRT